MNVNNILLPAVVLHDDVDLIQIYLKILYKWPNLISEDVCAILHPFYVSFDSEVLTILQEEVVLGHGHDLLSQGLESPPPAAGMAGGEAGG